MIHAMRGVLVGAEVREFKQWTNKETGEVRPARSVWGYDGASPSLAGPFTKGFHGKAVPRVWLWCLMDAEELPDRHADPPWMVLPAICI